MKCNISTSVFKSIYFCVLNPAIMYTYMQIYIVCRELCIHLYAYVVIYILYVYLCACLIWIYSFFFYLWSFSYIVSNCWCLLTEKNATGYCFSCFVRHFCPRGSLVMTYLGNELYQCLIIWVAAITKNKHCNSTNSYLLALTILPIEVSLQEFYF